MTAALRHRADEQVPCVRHAAAEKVRSNPFTSTWAAVMSTLTLFAVVFDVQWTITW